MINETIAVNRACGRIAPEGKWEMEDSCRYYTKQKKNITCYACNDKDFCNHAAIMTVKSAILLALLVAIARLIVS
jgi:hypothetical protein